MTTTIDLPTLVTIAQQIGATDLHLDTSRPPRARIDGHLHDLDGYDTPTNLQAALNQVAPGPTDTGRGNADDFIFTVGNQTCRTATWNENGNLGAMIRLLPAKGTPADLAHRAHTAKSALLYEELKRNQNL